jgi:hypothetical protein
MSSSLITASRSRSIRRASGSSVTGRPGAAADTNRAESCRADGRTERGVSRGVEIGGGSVNCSRGVI